MNIFTYNSLNLKKLRKYKLKVLLLVVPIMILVALTVLIPSEVQNITNAINQSFFGTVAQQSTLIQLSKTPENNNFQQSGGGFTTGSFSSSNNTFTESDLSTIQSIPNVTAAAISSTVPVSNAKTTNLITKKTVTINSLTGIDSELAGIYTTQNFGYSSDQPIPIILNANTLNETYEDWGGKDSVTIDITRGASNAQSALSESPIKTRAIDYNKDNLIGKEFTMSVGGLDPIQDYTQSFSSGGITFTKRTKDDIKTESESRKSDISTYWNYSKISTPLTYKFIVVGVINEEGNFTSYIPESAAQKIMKDYIQNQLDARNSTEIDTADLNSKFVGLTYNGTELQSSSFNVGGRLGRAIRVEGGLRGTTNTVFDQESLSSGSSYNIPGLIIQTEANTSSSNTSSKGFNPFANNATVVGEYKDSNVYSTSPKSGTTVLIKINDITNRTQVVADLNVKGFAYQDATNTSIFTDLQNSLKTVSIVLAVSFIVLSVLIIIFNMGKFVSESTKEIGILRAIGAKRSSIRNIFLLQAILYSVIAYVIGAFVGLILLFLAVAPLSNWFNNTIGNTLKQTYNVVQMPDSSVFGGIDWQSFAIYSIVFLVIVIIVSLIPAIRASRISPVKAIKGE